MKNSAPPLAQIRFRLSDLNRRMLLVISILFMLTYSEISNAQDIDPKKIAKCAFDYSLKEQDIDIYISTQDYLLYIMSKAIAGKDQGLGSILGILNLSEKHCGYKINENSNETTQQIILSFFNNVGQKMVSDAIKQIPR